LAHGLFDAIDEFYERVLVYGQPDIFDARTAYRFPPGVAARVRYVGYVAAPTPPARLPHPGERPVVLATIGAGEDGASVLEAFIAAARRQRWRAIAVTGPHLPAEARDRLEAAAEEAGVEIHVFLPNLAHLIATADALVSMGGYNTLLEAITAGTPTVCVPRVVPRTEQLMRARAFAQLDLLSLLEREGLGPERLRDEVERALGRQRPLILARAHARLRLDGAQQSAAELHRIARGVPDVGFRAAAP
jgi:predicted glycosyltransferase